jgi:DNA-binding CsgD family transcriptional regulator
MMASDDRGQALRGRGRECAVLEQLLDSVRDGSSQVLVLRGEAGIGKSALLHYLRTRAVGCRVARVAGIESEAELAYAGLHQLLAPMLGRRERLPPPQADAVGVAFGLSAGRPPDRLLVGLAVLSLLADVAEERPLVCIVEDAQWLDPVSVQVLAFVGRRLLAESVALVFATRDPSDGDELAGLHDLTIGGLDDADAGALLDSTVLWRLDERVKARMIAETRGNPLALLELPAGLTAAEMNLGLGLPSPAHLSNRIEEGFLRQLQPLPSDTRRFMLLAAVEPLGDAPLLWRAAASLEVSQDAARRAEATGLIELGRQARFRHPLVRSAVRRAADPSDVRAAHRALADATDEKVDPDRHAWHRGQAALAPDEAVAVDLVRAAVRARRRGGYASAAALFERAVELTPDVGERVLRLQTAALMKLFAADYEGGLLLVDAAASCPLDELELARLERLRAALMMSAGQTDEGSLRSLQAAKRLEPLDVESARAAHFSALSTRAFLGRLGDAQRMREGAEAARAAPRSADPPRVTDLLLDGLATWFLDGYGTAVPLLRRAIRGCIEEREPGLQLAEWVVFIPTLPPEIWDDDAWGRLTAHLISATRGAGGLLNIPMALDYRAGFEVNAGDLAAASAHLEESAAIKEATGSTPALTWMELAAWRGDETQAVEVIESSIEFWTARGDGRWISLAEYARAVLFNGLARYESALVAARRACEHMDIGLFGLCLAELIEAAHRTGEREVAVEALEQLEERARVAGTDWALGMLARSSAMLELDDTAERLYRESVERLERTHIKPQLARARLLYGEWLRRANRRVDAREQLRRAFEEFEQMGAEAFAQRARRELAATGEKVRKRTVETTIFLTPQEAQIARMAAEGESNPEIGSRLFISPRTVEYHLSKVFVKLDVKSRRELRTALR